MQSKKKQSRRVSSGEDVTEKNRLSTPLPQLPGARRKWAFRLAAVTVAILLLVGLELGLRLVGYGYPTGYFLKTRAQGREWLVENQKMTWRYFPPGLARSPQPALIAAAKPAAACRIFVLGESAAMGDPEPAFGFGRILEVLLRAKYPRQQIEVVNVAITAINSHVIRQIARDCAPCQGDVWVLYMGHNEVVGPFGAGTVFGMQAPHLALIRASLALKAARVGQLLDDLWHKAKSGKPAEWEGMEMFLQQQLREDDPRMSVVYGHFLNNLNDILHTAAACGAKVLLGTVVSNLKDCPPFASLHRADLTAAQRSKWDRLYQLGIEAEKTTNYDDALASYHQAAQIDNQFAELQFRMGRCELALGQDTQARQSFERARDLDTLRFRADTRINQLIRRAAQARSGEGLKLFEADQLLARNSPHSIAGEEFLFEHVHFNFQGNYLLARSLAEQIETSWPGVLGMPLTNAASHLSLEECATRLALTDRDRYQALDEMCRRFGQPPFTGQLDHHARDERFEKARGALQPGLSGAGLRESITIYERALRLAPADWMLHENFAQLLQSSGDPHGAEEEWRKVLKLMPHYEQACYSLGNVLDAQGKSAEAMQFLQQAVRRRPDSLEAHNGLGVALASQGKAAEAIREYKTALRRKPAFSDARVNLGQVLVEQGKVEAAMVEYSTALRFNSNNAAAHINLGKLLAAQKQVAAAVEHYETAIRLKPDSAVAHYNLGNALANHGKTEEAVHHFAEAVRFKPDFAEAHHNLGLELAKQGNSAEAFAQFTEAVRLKPGFAEAHLNLGVALAKERKFDAAIQHFQETLRLDPSNASARKFLEQALALQKKS